MNKRKGHTMRDETGRTVRHDETKSLYIRFKDGDFRSVEMSQHKRITSRIIQSIMNSLHIKIEDVQSLRVHHDWHELYECPTSRQSRRKTVEVYHTYAVDGSYKKLSTERTQEAY